MILLCLILFCYVFVFNGINITKYHHVTTTKILYVYVGVFVCVFVYLSVVGMHYKIKKNIVKEITVRSSQIFQFTSFPLGCTL